MPGIGHLMQVLLIEDDPQFVYLIQRYADTSGCLLLHASSFDQALALARQERPNLILLELASPNANSSQILHALKADPFTCRIPVFLCSTNEAILAESEEQADGCLLKPVMYQDFVTALQTHRSDRK